MIGERRVITPSIVSQVILAQRPTRELSAFAQLGREEHKRITQRIVSRAASSLPWEHPVPIPFEIDTRYMQIEKKFATDLGTGLMLSTRPDITFTNGGIIEIKPELAGRHIIQAMLSCMAVSKATDTNPVHAIIYTYRNGASNLDKTFIIPEGGKSLWGQLTLLCIHAYEIARVQEKIEILKDGKYQKHRSRKTLQAWDTLHGMPPGDHQSDPQDREFFALNNYIIGTRRDKFEPLLEGIVSRMNEMIIGG